MLVFWFAIVTGTTSLLAVLSPAWMTLAPSGLKAVQQFGGGALVGVAVGAAAPNAVHAWPKGTEPEWAPGAYMLFGFLAMASLQAFQHRCACSSRQLTGPRLLLLKWSGLLVHVALDGMAWGALVSTFSSENTSWAVALAMVVHRIPVGFALGTSLLEHRVSAWRSLRRNAALVLLFVLLDPIAAISTALLTTAAHGDEDAHDEEGGSPTKAALACFAVGSLLQIAMAHMPEELHHGHCHHPVPVRAASNSVSADAAAAAGAAAHGTGCHGAQSSPECDGHHGHGHHEHNEHCAMVLARPAPPPKPSDASPALELVSRSSAAQINCHGSQSSFQHMEEGSSSSRHDSSADSTEQAQQPADLLDSQHICTGQETHTHRHAGTNTHAFAWWIAGAICALAATVAAHSAEEFAGVHTH